MALNPNCTVCKGTGWKSTPSEYAHRQNLTNCPVCFPPRTPKLREAKPIPFTVGNYVLRKRNFAVGQVVAINQLSGRIQVCWYGENRNRLGSVRGDLYTWLAASAVVTATPERLASEISKFPGTWKRYYTQLVARRLGITFNEKEG